MLAATPYIGRFAPSPTGPLHHGSLLAAVASYLDAKANNGTWLVRMEDVDILRCIPGADTDILHALESHGLLWDGEVVYQSRRDTLYEQVLQQLTNLDLIYYCNCSRKKLRAQGSIYPGTCRNNRSVDYRPATREQPASHAIRFNTRGFKSSIAWQDRVWGLAEFTPAELGDFIIRRRDSLFAYQLAVVADDIDQQVTQVVRGSDLLDSTPWQLMLYSALEKPVPHYAHLPLVYKASAGTICDDTVEGSADNNAHNNTGNHNESAKLSKQSGARPIDNRQASANLIQALEWLGQDTHGLDAGDKPVTILAAAVESWAIDRIKKDNLILNQ